MSSNARKQGSPKTRSFFNGVTTMGSAKTRVFAFLTLVILTAVFSANALTATASAASTDTAASQQSGFVASSFNSFLSFFGFAGETAPPQAQVAAPVAQDEKEARVNGCDNAPQGLVACYRADSDASDVKGVHNGEWIGTFGYATGKVGSGAFSFDGASRVEVPNAADLNLEKATVDGWVNLSDVDGKFALLSKGDAYSLSVRAGSVVFVSRNAEGVSEILESRFKLQAGEWTHIAATHDGETRIIYVDGEVVATDMQKGLFTADEGVLAIGSSEARGRFTGLADEIGLFNRALTEKEIKEIAGNRPEGTITISIAPNPIPEQNVTATITVTRVLTGVAADDGAVQIALAGGGVGATATFGPSCDGTIDYVLGTPNVNFAANVGGPQTVDITICNDAAAEGAETWTLSAVATCAIGTASCSDDNAVIPSVPVTITDDDAVSIAVSSPTVPEGTGGAGNLVAYTLTVPAAQTSPLALVMSGTASIGPDYAFFFADNPSPCGGVSAVANAGALVTVTWAAPPVGGICTLFLRTTPDTDIEPDETAIMAVVATPASTGTVTIVNDDFTSVQFGPDPTASAEGAPGPQGAHVFNLVRTDASVATTVTFTVAGTATGPAGSGVACAGVAGSLSDYILSAGQPNVTFNAATCTGTVTFPVDSTTAVIDFSSVADRYLEVDETIIATIVAGPQSAPGNSYTIGGDVTDTAVIQDDDEAVTVTPLGASTVPESGPALQFLVTRNWLGGTELPFDDGLTVHFSLAGTANGGATCPAAGTVDYNVTFTNNDVYFGTTGTYDPATCTGTIVFGAEVVGVNDTTGIIVVTPINDTAPENNETVIIQLLPGDFNPSQYGVGTPYTGNFPQVAPFPANSTATGTITNDDYQVIVQVSPPSVPEGSEPPAGDQGGTLVYTFTRIGQTPNANAANSVCANFSASGTGASAVDDYTVAFGVPVPAGSTCTNVFTANAGASPGQININPGQGPGPLVNGVETNQNTLIVTPTDDNTVEADEEVQIQVENHNGLTGPVYTMGSPAQASGLIINDDSQRIEVTVNGPVAEGNVGYANTAGGVLTYTFTRTLSNGQPLSVTYTVAGGTATVIAPQPASADDFQNPPFMGNNVVQFGAADTVVTVQVTAAPDNNVEPNEGVRVTVLDGTGYTALGAPATGVISNDDNDVACSGPVPASVPENTGALVFTCTRTTDGGAGQLALSVPFTLGGTAVAGDYTVTGDVTGGNTLNFGAGNSTAVINVTPVNDAVVEADETVIVTFTGNTDAAHPVNGSPQGYDLTGSPLTGTITNDDNTVSVAVLAVAADGTTAVTAPNSTSIYEDSSNLLRYTFTRVTQGAAAALALPVNYNVNGTVVGIAACASAPCTDGFAVDFTVPTGGFTAAAGTGTITIPANATSVAIIVDPNPDSSVEPNETVNVAVAVGANYTATGTAALGNILNDDISFSVAAVGGSANEGHDNVTAPHGVVPEAPTETGLTPHGSHATFTVTRAGDTSTVQRIDISTIPTTVPPTNGAGTATSALNGSSCGVPGADYITDGKTLEFAVGDTTKTFYVAVCGDRTYENDETINVQLTNPQPNPNAPFTTTIPVGTATWTILNDDGGPNGSLFVRATNVTVAEGGVANFQACLYTTAVSSASDTPAVAGSAIFFDYATGEGSALDPEDYTGSATLTGVGNEGDDIVIPAGSSCSGNIVVPTFDDALFEGDENFFIQISNINAGLGNTNSSLPALGQWVLAATTTNPVFPAVTLAPGQGRGIILDNEGQNTYYITDVHQAEGNGGDSATSFNHQLTQVGSSANAQTICVITQDGNRALPSPFGPNPALGGVTASGVYDYTTIAGPNCYTFTPGGPTTITVPVIVNGDLYFENDDTYTVRLVLQDGTAVSPLFGSNPSHPGDPNYAGLGIGTIQNDDATPIVGLTTQPSALETDSGTFNVPVEFTVTGATLLPVTVTYSVAAGGLPAGSVPVVLGAPAPTPNPPATGCTGTVDLYAPTNGASSSPFSIPTASVASPSTGPYVATANLVGCGDLRAEADETFTVTIDSTSGAIRSPLGTAAGGCTVSSASCGNKAGVIRDNDFSGYFRFTEANGEPTGPLFLPNGDVSLAEGSTVGGQTDFTFYVRRVGPVADYAISMTLETVDGTAQDDVPSSDDNDYVARNNIGASACNVVFPAGSDAPQPCTVKVNHDSVQEIDETFTLQVTNISSPLGTSTSPLAGNIIGRGPGGVQVVYNQQYGTPANPAAAGTDLIAQGNILNDDGSRVFSVTSVTQTEGTVSPYDGTSTKLFVHRIEAQGSSNQVSTVNFLVRGSASPSNGLTAAGGATCATADNNTPGTDFINTSGTATFQPTGSGTGAGFDFVDVPVLVCTDTRIEANDTYRVELTAISNASISTGSGNGLGTIQNDDGATYSLVTSTININEGNTPGNGQSATITVVRTGGGAPAASLAWATANGSATGTTPAGTACSGTPVSGNPDFQSSAANASVAIPANSASGSTFTIQVPICGDTFAEIDEAFTVVITPSDALAGTTLTATVNIINDDGPISGANGFEGDVVADDGNKAGGGGVKANDVTVIARALLGLEPLVTNPNQFQRGDVNIPCGNGVIDAGDVTVISQWALGLNLPLPVACGPTAPAIVSPSEESRTEAVGRTIRAVSPLPIPVGSTSVTVSFVLDSQGDEASAAYSITFPQGTLSNPVVVLGSGVPSNTALGTNPNDVLQGRLGVLIATPNAYAAGTREMIRVTFTVAPGAVAGTYPIGFSSTPVGQSVSSAVGGAILATAYEPGNVVIGATAAGVRVSGRVTTPNGQGLRNATVVMTDSEGKTRTAVTSSFGIYTFDDVESGNSYVVSVSARRYRFGSRVVNVSDTLADVDFVGQE